MGWPLKEFIARYYPNPANTFYYRFKNGKLLITDIVLIGKVLRLNPMDYMPYEYNLDNQLIKAKQFRTRELIKKVAGVKEEEPEPEDNFQKLGDLFK